MSIVPNSFGSCVAGCEGCPTSEMLDDQMQMPGHHALAMDVGSFGTPGVKVVKNLGSA
jgi:hypothetical protein